MLHRTLLTAQDVPGLTVKRPYVGANPTTQPTPQLALCRPQTPVGSHQTASVLASPARPGQAQVFEIVSVFASPAAAGAAYEQALGAATACRRFVSGGTTFSVQDLAPLSLPGADAAGHYRLVASTVIDGDVRTLARSGSKVVLLTGYGAPPGGLSPLAYQAQILARLLKHL